MIPDRPALTEDDVTDAMVAAGRFYLDTYNPNRVSAWSVVPEMYAAMERARVEGVWRHVPKKRGELDELNDYILGRAPR